jgi:hypothetical protein
MELHVLDIVPTRGVKMRLSKVRRVGVAKCRGEDRFPRREGQVKHPKQVGQEKRERREDVERCLQMLFAENRARRDLQQCYTRRNVVLLRALNYKNSKVSGRRNILVGNVKMLNSFERLLSKMVVKLRG